MLISSSTAFAQVLNALFSPIITRIYSPEEYGILTVYMSILGLISIVASLKYEWGIPIAEDNELAINIMALSFAALFLFTFLLFIFLLFFGRTIFSVLNVDYMLSYKYLVLIGVFFVAAYNILLQWAFRKKDFKAISKTKYTQSIAGNGVKVIFGLFGAGSIGLLVGHIISQCAGIGTLSKSFKGKYKYLCSMVNVNTLLYGATRYKNFPIFTAPSQLLNTAGIQLPVFFITSLYGSQVLGFYGLANSIVNFPMILIGNSVADVLYSEAASVGRKDPKRIKDLSNKLFKKLVIIGLIPLLVLLFFGPFLFSFVFGSRWYEAGVYAQIISFLVFARLIFTPISRIFFVYEKQKANFLLDLFRVILVIVTFIFAKLLFLSSYVAVIIYSIAMCIVYFVTYLLSQRILNQEIKMKEIRESKTSSTPLNL